MRIGISVTSAITTGQARDGARFMVERARAAHEAGLDALFVGDHHVTSSRYYQNTPILGRMLAEWRSERPFGALYLLPLWHPVILAEQVATLACIGQGPFILQCALGHGRSVFEAMGVEHSQRPSRFEQALTTLRALWSGETVDLDGRWKLSGAHISPLPPEPVEVWIGASAPPAIERAARLGDAWLGTPGTTPQQTLAQLEIYREACARHGRPVGKQALRRDIFVGGDAAEAARVGERYVQAGYRGFDPAALVYGDVGQVAEAFAAFRDMGVTDLIVRNLASEQELALATIERLALVRERLG